VNKSVDNKTPNEYNICVGYTNSLHLEDYKMETLKKIFPLSFKYTDGVANLIIGILLQLVVGIIAGVVIWVAGFLTGIPVLGAILALVLRILGTLVDLYVLAGIIIQILVFAKIIKD
jgi:hypothetical protein